MVDQTHVEKLRKATSTSKLLKYLEKELDWPIVTEELDDNFFEYSPEELQFKPDLAAKIKSISRLRPPSSNIEMPWGIFFIEFSTKNLPLLALRRILNQFVEKKRQSKDLQSWEMGDLLFVSNYGEDEQRKISLCLFNEDKEKSSLPRLKVIEWSDQDTHNALEGVANTLKENLGWPDDDLSTEDWQVQWQSAFISDYREEIKTSKILAKKLAELAKNVKNSVQEALVIEHKEGYLHQQLKEFKKVLIHDLSETAFADMYAQTIAYGLLTAEITNPKNNEGDRIGEIAVTNPFLKELLKSFLEPDEQYGASNSLNFDELEISEIKELLDNSDMRAILRDFGAKNPEEDPVVQFYEFFLKEYDSKIKKTLGVFYTPRSVVSFIVRSVDELLRTEFNLKYGLADTTTWGEMIERFDELEIPKGAAHDQAFVQILDPATGTGTFLIEIIDLIYKTMQEKWQSEGCDRSKIDHLWNDYVPNHLLPRLHAYELMMAPYAIAHIQIGLKLYETGYSFKGDEMARIFLTNSLDQPKDYSGMFEFASSVITEEAEGVNLVKRDQRFTVVIGNPPYSMMSANLSEENRRLIDIFRHVDGERIVEKNAIALERTLQNDYVKFYALACRTLLATSTGILAYISSNSFLDSLNLRGMRFFLLNDFQQITVIDLHGDSDVREKAQDGSKDENVFAIKSGVSIFLARKSPKQTSKIANLARADLLGTKKSKYEYLSNHSIMTTQVTSISPRPDRYVFAVKDEAREREFAKGISISNLFLEYATGIETGKDSILMDFDKNSLDLRLKHFGDPSIDDELVIRQYGAEKGNGRRIADLRKTILTDPDYSKRFVPITFIPFDERVVFYRTDLISVHSKRIARHLIRANNISLIAMRQVKLDRPFSHIFVSRNISNNRCFLSKYGKVYMLPIAREQNDGLKFDLESSSSNYRTDTSEQLFEPPSNHDPDLEIESDLLYFIYAQLHSPAYRSRYSAQLKENYPTVFAVKSPNLRNKLTEIGRELVQLHLFESHLLEDHISSVVGSGPMQVEKVSYDVDTIWIDKSCSKGFYGIVDQVWNFEIGGYRPCQKWLKNRQAKGGKNPHPGRVLTDEDIEHFQKIIVAISETIRIMEEIDEVIEEHGGWPDAFSTND